MACVGLIKIYFRNIISMIKQEKLKWEPNLKSECLEDVFEGKLKKKNKNKNKILKLVIIKIFIYKSKQPNNKDLYGYIL